MEPIPRTKAMIVIPSLLTTVKEQYEGRGWKVISSVKLESEDYYCVTVAKVERVSLGRRI